MVPMPKKRLTAVVTLLSTSVCDLPSNVVKRLAGPAIAPPLPVVPAVPV